MALTTTQKALLITLAIYSAIVGATLYAVEQSERGQSRPTLQEVPIALNMFSAPPVQEATPPPAEPQPPVEKAMEKPVEPPKPEVKPEPKKALPKKVDVKKVNPKKVEPKKVVKQVENKIKPKPVKTPPKPKVEKKPEPEKPVKKVVQTPTPAVKPTPEQPVEKVATQSASAPPVKKPTRQVSLKQQQEAEHEYLYNLQKTLVKYAADTYPYPARRRHWQGQVTVSFDILANGRIVNVQVVKPNERDVFNQAARSIFTEKMSMRFRPFPKDIPRDRWSLVVPINYTLR